MNEDAKKFRSKYFYAARRTTLPEDFDKSVENLANMKSSLEEAAEYKVLGKEKTVQEKVQDLQAYIEEDIDL